MKTHSFLDRFGKLTQKSAATKRFDKISTRENKIEFRYFAQMGNTKKPLKSQATHKDVFEALSASIEELFTKVVNSFQLVTLTIFIQSSIINFWQSHDMSLVKV